MKRLSEHCQFGTNYDEHLKQQPDINTPGTPAQPPTPAQPRRRNPVRMLYRTSWPAGLTVIVRAHAMCFNAPVSDPPLRICD